MYSRPQPGCPLPPISPCIPRHCWNWKFLSAYSSFLLNTAILELFAGYKIVSKYAERVYTYMKLYVHEAIRTWRRRSKTQTIRYPRLILVQHDIFLDSYFLYKMCWIRPKNHFTLSLQRGHLIAPIVYSYRPFNNLEPTILLLMLCCLKG
jgi:hypothetical protein